MPSRPLRLAVVTMLAGALLVGCAAEARGIYGVPSITQISDWDSSLDTLLTVRKVTLLSQPRVIADEVVVAYVADEAGDVYLRAWEIVSGDQVWEERAVPGFDSEHREMFVPWQYLEGRATIGFIASPIGSPSRRTGNPRIVDALTGENLTPALDEKLFEGYRPSICDDAYCVAGRYAGGSYKQFTFTPADGGTVTEQPRGTVYRTRGGDLLGKYISTRHTDDSETLEYIDGGTTVWSRPYTEVFGEKFSSNNGWSWTSEDTSLPVIGVGYPSQDDLDLSVAQSITRMYGAGTTLALDRSTGETLWAHERVGSCGTVGGLLVVETVLVACRFNSGEVTYEWDGTKVTDTRWDDMDIDMIGLDPQTGETLWTVPLGDDPANYADTRDAGDRPFVINGDIVTVVDGVSLTVDAATGETSAFADNVRLLCVTESEETVPLTGPENVDTLVDYDVAAPREMCGPDAKPLKKADVSRSALKAAGYDLTSPVAINLNGDIVVFDATEPKPGKAKAKADHSDGRDAS